MWTGSVTLAKTQSLEKFLAQHTSVNVLLSFSLPRPWQVGTHNIFFQHCLTKIYKHTEKLKEFSREHLSVCHLPGFCHEHLTPYCFFTYLYLRLPIRPQLLARGTVLSRVIIGMSTLNIFPAAVSVIGDLGPGREMNPSMLPIFLCIGPEAGASALG